MSDKNEAGEEIQKTTACEYAGSTGGSDMSWPTGTCSDCGNHCDYRYSWGYEKPDGLDWVRGRPLCGACRERVVLYISPAKCDLPDEYLKLLASTRESGVAE